MPKARDGCLFRFIGLRLEVQRLILGLSLQDLARSTGIDASRLAAYETGETPVKSHDLEVLAAALGVSIKFFFLQDRGVPLSVEGIGETRLAAAARHEAEARGLGKAFAKLKNPKVRQSMLEIARARDGVRQSDH